jgi:hypothetical protein
VRRAAKKYGGPKDRIMTGKIESSLDLAFFFFSSICQFESQVGTTVEDLKNSAVLSMVEK